MNNSNDQPPRIGTNVSLQNNDKLAYDKAIEGYQFQVGRYNIWMNYYAIFTGAFFVALYSIWPSASGGCGCCKCCMPQVSGTGWNIWFLPLVISLLGLWASICWYGALLGYRKWNEHWMGIVRQCERNVLNPTGNTGRQVYDKMPHSPYYAVGYISTQKITGLFIIGIILAWLSAIWFIAFNHYGNCCCAWCWCEGAGFVALIALIMLHYSKCKLYSSRINRV